MFCTLNVKNFWGELTNTSATTKALVQTSAFVLRIKLCMFGILKSYLFLNVVRINNVQGGLTDVDMTTH